MGFKGRSIISIHDLSRKEILHILDTAADLEADPQPLLQGKVIATLFYEPSTRTRISFETAAQRLGGRIIGFSDAKQSSVSKGESLSDTTAVISGYADLIVIRHPHDGAARLASNHSTVPVINAGDGANQHPTQTLLDLYTIRKTQGRLDGLKVALVGDLRYGRTTHSLAEALAHFGAKITLISPPSLRMPEHVTRHLKATGVDFKETEDLKEAIPEQDIIYMTRIQRERFPDEEEYEKVRGSYILDAEMIATGKESMKVMHPLPRVDEISTDVDKTRHAAYFEQSANGVPIRQALLCLCLGVTR